MEWSTRFPQSKGLYWFYGYRYGKNSFFKHEPELILVEVRKVSNGFMYVSNGQFIYKKEVEEPHFQKVILPELPRMEEG